MWEYSWYVGDIWELLPDFSGIETGTVYVFESVV